MFPVLWQGPRAELAEYVRLGCPKRIPWERIAPHEAQALHNHDQTLERLAERGGLSPFEIMCAVEGHDLWPIPQNADVAAVPKLLAWLAPPSPTKEPTK
jgi:hypothetical protein